MFPPVGGFPHSLLYHLGEVLPYPSLFLCLPAWRGFPPPLYSLLEETSLLPCLPAWRGFLNPLCFLLEGGFPPYVCSLFEGTSLPSVFPLGEGRPFPPLLPLKGGLTPSFVLFLRGHSLLSPVFHLGRGVPSSVFPIQGERPSPHCVPSWRGASPSPCVPSWRGLSICFSLEKGFLPMCSRFDSGFPLVFLLYRGASSPCVIFYWGLHSPAKFSGMERDLNPSLCPLMEGASFPLVFHLGRGLNSPNVISLEQDFSPLLGSLLEGGFPLLSDLS